MVKSKTKASAKKTKRKKSAKKAPAKRGFFKSLLSSLLKLLFTLAFFAAIVFALYVWYLDRQVVSKFSGNKWAVPAHVYARPLELYEGLDLNPKQLVEEAHSLGYGSNTEKPGSAVQSGNTVQLYTRGFEFLDGAETAKKVTVSFSNSRIVSIKDGSGNTVSLMRLEPMLIGGIYPDHNEDRMLVRYDDLPQQLIDTLLAVEDRNFFTHHGISIRGIARALYTNISSSEVRQGGSTLTQQLVKNFYLTSERSIKRKAIEAIMAILLEVHYTKEEILEAYVNEIYLGQNREKAIHGFGLASYYYFNKPLTSLDLDQIATLVGIVKGPSRYDPKRRPDNAIERRNQVLSILQKQGDIDAETAQAAQQKPLRLGDKKADMSRVYPAYLDLVHRQLQRDYQEEDLKSEGLKIFTSFDPQVQWQAERSLDYNIQRMEKRIAAGSRDQLQAAIVVLNPENGEVLAIVGDKKSQYAGFNRAIDTQRPIGSLVKPAVYLAALENPDKFSLASVLSDRKISMISGGERWEPRNFNKREHGDVMLYRALAVSYNLATVNLGLEVGLDKVVDTLKKLGVKGNIPEVPALTLGALGRSPYEVAEMYQTIAANGFYTPLRAIRDVLDVDGNTLKRYPLKVEKRFSGSAVYLLQFAMHEVMRAGTGKSAYKSISKSIELAGKTGTSNEQRDSWFAGFGANRLAVVWVGRDDNKPMPFSGGTGALPIWTSMMSRLQPRSLELFEPPGIENAWVDAGDATLTRKDCPQAILLPFVKGSEPQQVSQCIRRTQLEAEEEAIQERLQKTGKSVMDWVNGVLP